jgi:hypothetical protein
MLNACAERVLSHGLLGWCNFTEAEAANRLLNSVLERRTLIVRARLRASTTSMEMTTRMNRWGTGGYS